MDITPTVGADEQSQYRQNLAIQALHRAFAEGRVGEVVTSTRTYYVDGGTGSDTNSGLLAAAGFATIQKALDVVATLYLASRSVTVTISVAAGSTYAGFSCPRFVGPGTVLLSGSTGSPITINSTVSVGPAGPIGDGCRLRIQGFKFTGNILIADHSILQVEGNCEFAFNSTTAAQVQLTRHGVLRVTSSFTVSGSMTLCHYDIRQSGAVVWIGPITVTFSPGTHFSNGTNDQAFILGDTNGTMRFVKEQISFGGTTFTGINAILVNGAQINSGGASTSFFPGTVPAYEGNGLGQNWS